MMKGLIYFPFPLPEAVNSGSSVRPLAMVTGFRKAGLDVDVISGTSGERKRQIHALKRGNSLDDVGWIYIESSTMPIGLSDPDRIPRRPFMDARFWRYCRARGIPVGLFYRDVYWRFPDFRSEEPIKNATARLFHKLEWTQFEDTVQHLFLPSLRMNGSLPRAWREDQLSALPPGCGVEEISGIRNTVGLQMLYVGGVTPPFYDLRPLFRALPTGSRISVVICCRQPEWEQAKHLYEPLPHGVVVTHRSGDDLRELYVSADVVLIIREPHPYLDFAMPVKLFEAMGWGKPVITNNGTAVADFVREHEIGWIISDESQLAKLVARLEHDRGRLIRVTQKMHRVRSLHTWETRAKAVAKTLLAYKK